MVKPTRDEFRAQVLMQFPGATIVKAERGMTVVVGTREIAETVKAMALDRRLAPNKTIYSDGPESFTVAIFGFPRRPENAAVAYRPADDDNLKAVFEEIRDCAARRAGELDVDQAEFIRLQHTMALADKGLRLLQGKDQ